MTPETTDHTSLLTQLSRIIRQADRGMEASVVSVLELGCQQFGLTVGILARVERERYIIEQVVQPEGHGIEPGQVFELGQTYCREVVTTGQPLGEHHVSQSALRTHRAFKALGIEAYLGVQVMVAGRLWGTLNFSCPAPRESPFTTKDIEAVELLAAWLGSELQRQELIAASEQDRQHAQAMADRFEAFMANSPALKWATDEQGRYLFANDVYARVMNIDPQQAIGHRPEEVLAPETHQALSAVDQQTQDQARDSPDRLNFYVQAPVGDRVVPLYVSKFVFEDVHGQKIVGGSAIDMTQVSRVEGELRESEERFKQAFENAPIGLALVSLQGNWLQVNTALCELLGYNRDQLEALDFQTITHPEDLPKDLALLKSIIENQDKSYQIDKRYIHSNGQVVWARVSVSLVRNVKTREPLYLISQIEDITKQRQSEEELASRNADLETLLYVISHDLREPLRAVRSFSWIVREDYGAALDERGKDMLSRVIRGAERLDQLLGDVLTLSRAQRADRFAVAVKSKPIVEEVVSELQAKIEETQATIHIDTDLPTITIDERWLKRAVFNLLINALKFTNPGQPPEVTVSRYRPKAHRGGADAAKGKIKRREPVGLVVHDRGPGVAAELREKVFGLFQRGVGRTVPGTGAGLAIVAQIAERYGGRAWVEDRPGGGSSFFITFTPNG